ncbi:hypothetical protein [Ferrimonas futtsuensis]|uniref:hypothetical protein n=1 Tax=Ferrimonas futtsuensis TaxID=364764 RepID=UPI0003F6EB2B|nr:hypothetical protein [Ferrimonas futtsuensis]
MTLLLSLLVTSMAGTASAADDGMAPLEKPTTQVFNNKRKFNKEQVIYKNTFWRCSRYRSDGSCVSVEKVPEDEVTFFDDLKKTNETSQKTYETPQKTNETSKRGNYKIENPDDAPCACVFNNKRMWNPEKIIWNDQYWRCVHYREDGTCSGVEVIPPKELEQMELKEQARKAKELASQDKPIPGVFHKKNRIWTPEKVRFKEKEWQCSSYSEDGLCLGVEEVVEQPEPESVSLEFDGIDFAKLSPSFSCEAFGERQMREKLTLAEFDRFLAMAKEREMWNETDIQAIRSDKIMIGMSPCGVMSLMGYPKMAGGDAMGGYAEGWSEYHYKGEVIIANFLDYTMTEFRVVGNVQ